MRKKGIEHATYPGKFPLELLDGVSALPDLLNRDIVAGLPSQDDGGLNDELFVGLKFGNK